MLANHPDGEALLSPTICHHGDKSQLAWCFEGKHLHSLCLYCIVCLYMYNYMHWGFSSPYPQIALPLLGDIGALFKVLCGYVRNYVLTSGKNQKGNLYENWS